MTMSLTAVRAPVTDASSGIGETVAVAFAEMGTYALLHYGATQGAPKARVVLNRIRALGGQASAMQSDASDLCACGQMRDPADRDKGGIDAVGAKANIQRDASLTEMSLEDWHKVMAAALTGHFLCAQEAARRFCAQPRRPFQPTGTLSS